MKPPFFLKLFVLTFFIVFSLHPAALFAEDPPYLEDNGTSLWDEQQYLNSSGQEFTTEDPQYVGEQDVKAAQEAAKQAGLPSVDLASALDKDKQLLPDNMMYGIGTGALIGGWFALVEGGNARDNVRYLTVGTLVGALLGVAIGYKSLFTGKPTNVSSIMSPTANTATAGAIEPNLVITPNYARLDLQFHF